MAGLVPAIHVLLVQGSNSWMPGTGPGVTKLVPRLLLRHELQHRIAERIVAVARHHVTRLGDVDVVRMGHEFEKFAHVRLVNQLR